jgi:hypothetical protein
MKLWRHNALIDDGPFAVFPGIFDIGSKPKNTGAVGTLTWIKPRRLTTPLD